MAKKRFHSGSYEGYDNRRRMERKDAGMISEDRSAIANLPQAAIYRAFPSTEYASYGLDDTIKGIDNQMNKDIKGEKKSGKHPEKY